MIVQFFGLLMGKFRMKSDAQHYTFLLLKPSTFKRCGFMWNHTIADEIIKRIKKFKFEVISLKKIKVSTTDIMRFYKDDVNKIKKENYENAKKMFEGYMKTLHKKNCIY
jgi:nucleoside diphosphate kinase